MSVKVQAWVWEQVRLLPQQKLVLLWLADRATDNGMCFPGQAEIRHRTGLGEKMVRRHLHALASDNDSHGRAPLLDIIERPVSSHRHTSNVYVLRVPWARVDAVKSELAELKHMLSPIRPGWLTRENVSGDPQVSGDHTATAARGRGRVPEGVVGDRQERVTDDPREPSPGRYHREPPPSHGRWEPRGQEHGPKVEETGTECPAPPVPCTEVVDTAARALVDVLYRGLGIELDGVMPALRRRELTIARQLAEIGAVPEAEAYARDAPTQPGRIAAVDMRSYERERVSWNARRQAARQAEVHGVDRTGEPPGGVKAGSLARALFGGRP